MLMIACAMAWSYSSSGDFAHRIASLVAFNAAKVRAILVFKALELPQAIAACPGILCAGDA
jgi:hypothetical protein